MHNKSIVTLSIILGIFFVIIAFVYWFVPAGSLPMFMPGYIADSTDTHFKHGLLSIILAILLFIVAWFKSAKKAI